MIQITIWVDGVPQVKKIPVKWEEVTFKQFLDLQDCGDDYIKALSYFTGIDYNVLLKAKIKGLDEVLHLLAFLRTDPPMVLPSKILFYPIPKDLGFEAVGQYKDVQDEVNKGIDQNISAKEQLAKYPLYCAIYACKHMSWERCAKLGDDIIHGEYDWRKAEAMKDEFLNAPAAEVLAVGHFTLLKLIGLKQPIKKVYPPRITPQKRFKLVLKRWLLRLGDMGQLFTWKRKPAEQKMS